LNTTAPDPWLSLQVHYPKRGTCWLCLAEQKRHEEALACHVRAASTWDWAPKPYIARALRGQGVQLIDLERLNEAEQALQRSLKLQPDSGRARHELQYIADLRKKRRIFPGSTRLLIARKIL
jgi:tetratricopeptide (TPR) repeat protein